MELSIKEEYWSRFADDYEERQAYVVGEDLIQDIKKRLHSENELLRVLELGCGTGLYTEDLCQVAESVIATDFSDEMIAKAKEIRKELHKVDFIKENAMNLSFKDESFDTVFMANLIHIVADPNKIIAESRRVLKPGGRIIITSFSIDVMSFFNKLKMASRYIKTFGKVSEEAKKVKVSFQSVEKMLLQNKFNLMHREILGSNTKSMYFVAEKLLFDE